jgi:maleamate amidohydrolase
MAPGKKRTMAVSDDGLSSDQRKICEVGSWGKHVGFGLRPAVIVVDVHFDFIGDKPEPIFESIKRATVGRTRSTCSTCI